MSAALKTRGLKRVCSECGGRFYDLNKRPITCPSCETEFTGEMKLKGRRGRAAAADLGAKGREEVEVANDEVVETNDEVVSLEDVAASEAGDEEEAADLENIEDEDLGDIGKDLSDLDAGVEIDEDDEDLEADIDVSKDD